MQQFGVFQSRKFLLFDTHDCGGGVVAFDFDPTRLAALPHCSAYLGGFAGKHGDVIVVKNRKDFIAVAFRRNGRAFKKGNVFGGIVQTNGRTDLSMNAARGAIIRCFFDRLPTSVPASQARDCKRRV